MATYRCSDCGINYPSNYSFRVCGVHHETTSYFSDVEPDEDWQLQLAAILEQVTSAESESLDDLIPLVDTKVIIRPGGAYFVSSWDVYDSVRGRLKSGDLFRVGK